MGRWRDGSFIFFSWVGHLISLLLDGSADVVGVFVRDVERFEQCADVLPDYYVDVVVGKFDFFLDRVDVPFNVVDGPGVVSTGPYDICLPATCVRPADRDVVGRITVALAPRLVLPDLGVVVGVIRREKFFRVVSRSD